MVNYHLLFVQKDNKTSSLNFLFIKNNSLRQRCSPSNMLELTFYSHVENIIMTASFHEKGNLSPYNWLNLSIIEVHVRSM